MQKYLTKSIFKLGCECPTKLFYYSQKETYANQKIDDPFLEALAQGGFQIGALAQAYYPEGIEITNPHAEAAFKETMNYLKQDQVTLFEPTFIYEGLLAKVDILVKSGDVLSILEVKSKSIDFKNKPNPFIVSDKKTGDRLATTANIHMYIYDIAFQKHLLTKLFPEMTINASLYLIDKHAECPSDELSKKFILEKLPNNRTSVSLKQSLTDDELDNKLLRKVDVNRAIDIALSENLDNISLKDRIPIMRDAYLKCNKLKPILSKQCKICEFKNNSSTTHLNNGFKECWKEIAGFDDNDFSYQSILDIWHGTSDKFIQEGKFEVTQLYEEDFSGARGPRQWLQVQRAASKDHSLHIKKDELRDEMATWTYPLHMIDFENIRALIPYRKGDKPNKLAAFQFSHHIIDADGNVTHADEFFYDDVRDNPNLHFIRALKQSLSSDEGSIFMYSNHENACLNEIYRDLNNYVISEAERTGLKTFIQHITKASDNSKEQWSGERKMIDLQKCLLDYYYDPAMKGSNSIKALLPSVMNRSEFLKQKYGKPIYGTANGIKSLNFDGENMIWHKMENNVAVDPYSLLPPIDPQNNANDEDIALLFDDEALKDGGAAMMAYTKMQYTEMSQQERALLRKALLRYCELDTLAMVMVVEAWQDLVNN